MSREKYPKFIEGYAIVRDASKKFIKQLPHQDIVQEVADGGWRMDFEIQLIQNGSWIPLEDLVGSAVDVETRAKVELDQESSPNSLLIRASRLGDYDLAKWALEFGADVNYGEDEPLYLAVERPCGHSSGSTLDT